jgi:hypothetical protein
MGPKGVIRPYFIYRSGRLCGGFYYETSGAGGTVRVFFWLGGCNSVRSSFSLSLSRCNEKRRRRWQRRWLNTDAFWLLGTVGAYITVKPGQNNNYEIFFFFFSFFSRSSHSSEFCSIFFFVLYLSQRSSSSILELTHRRSFPPAPFFFQSTHNVRSMGTTNPRQ